MAPELRQATAADVPELEALLASQHLPPQGLLDCVDTCWVLEDGGRLIACAGLELYGEAALLRSVIVESSYRNRRHGERLVRNAIGEARRRGIQTLFLFTMEASGYFARFGFEGCDLEDFPEAVRSSFQYRGVSSMPELQGRVTAMRLEIAD
ncbi:MAG TPA: GNAT family N-acetyltransferase [Dehalococcoidia bacterium]|nr:GNAT family N-acetyltransferase [Dehalococcoidia bacterium]